MRYASKVFSNEQVQYFLNNYGKLTAQDFADYLKIPKHKVATFAQKLRAKGYDVPIIGVKPIIAEGTVRMKKDRRGNLRKVMRKGHKWIFIDGYGGYGGRKTKPTQKRTDLPKKRVEVVLATRADDMHLRQSIRIDNKTLIYYRPDKTTREQVLKKYGKS